MNPKRKLSALFLLLALVTLWPTSAKRNSAGQEAKPDYKNNNCVNCHSRLLEPLHVGNRYLEWQFSRHRDEGVSCKKCHGGNPPTKCDHIFNLKNARAKADDPLIKGSKVK